jgi:hypothetical protein
MAIVSHNFPVNLFVAQADKLSYEQRGLESGLRVNQLVQAKVIASELGPLLELNQQLFKVEGEAALSAGQVLLLRVLQTEPRLEFNVLAPQREERLTQLLPLLTRSYDWQGLLKGNTLITENLHFVRQLEPLLSFAGHRPELVRQELVQLSQALATVLPLPAKNTDAALLPPATVVTAMLPAGASQKGALPSLPEHFLPFATLIQSLNVQLSKLPQAQNLSAPHLWHTETRAILAQFNDLPRPAPAVLSQLTLLLGRLQQQPLVSPQLSQDIGQLLTRLADVEVLPATAFIGGRSAATLPAGAYSATKPVSVPTLVRQNEGLASTSTEGDIGLASLEKHSQQIMASLQPLVEQKQPLSPEILGRLEGLLERLSSLKPASTDTLPSPELIANLTQMVHSTLQSIVPPDGRTLGALGQLFGFHMERELLEGKLKDALANLKATLLAAAQDTSDDVQDPLRRIELFQLCKARLAEEGLAFLPLPFAELEEGYLLAERETSGKEGADPLLNMSMSLRLSALGNLRVDMLYDGHGLQLRLACDGQEKMNYVQGAQAELREGLQAVNLQGLSFAADAREPASQLGERLNPTAKNLLDERI